MCTSLFLPVLFFGVLCSCHNNSPGRLTDKVRLTEPVDSIVVIKSERRMEVYHNQRMLKSYHVCLGSEPVGPKHFQGDGKTPEGMYRIDGKNPFSSFHKCLGVSYPSDRDRQYAKRAGRPTGGDIKIHGLPNGRGHLLTKFIKKDWTAGCIALTDEEIDEVYTHTDVGVCINILP